MAKVGKAVRASVCGGPLNAERRLLEVREALLVTCRERLLAAVGLFRAMGGAPSAAYPAVAHRVGLVVDVDIGRIATRWWSARG